MKIVLAMSGGVDSSVCAHLLTRAGHDVTGVFMRHGIQIHSTDSDGNPLRRKHGCCSEEDARDAQRVADRFGIPLRVMDFHDEFQQIVDYFVREYSSCRTPNPCIVCNALLKFGKIFDFADSIGADRVATGHYARILPTDQPADQPADQPTDQPDGAREFNIWRGLDEGKDQSYVLHRIPREKLSRLIFPLGDFRKEAIRQIAEEAGLHVAHKRDSQEICFVPDGDHARFVKECVFQKTGEYPNTRGDFVTLDGQNLGPHEGLERYTIGQRKGLRLAFREPHFVVRLEPETNRVILGLHDDLARTELTASDVVWQIPDPQAPFECEVKIRYRSPSVPALVTPQPDRKFRLTFHSPVYGIAPGQAAVCYSGEKMLGGGWID